MTNRIALKSPFFELAKNREKTTTIRKGVRKYAVGHGELVCGERKLPIYISSVEYKTVHDLTNTDAKNDGFHSVQELREALLNIYPNLSIFEKISIVYFEITEPGWGPYASTR